MKAKARPWVPGPDDLKAWRCVHCREVAHACNPPVHAGWDCNLLRLPCCGFDACALEQKRERVEARRG